MRDDVLLNERWAGVIFALYSRLCNLQIERKLANRSIVLNSFVFYIIPICNFLLYHVIMSGANCCILSGA